MMKTRMVAVAACLAATICYAGSSIYMKKRAAGERPVQGHGDPGRMPQAERLEYGSGHR